MSKLTWAAESDKKHCPRCSWSQGCMRHTSGGHLGPPTPNREAEHMFPGPLTSISCINPVRNRLSPSSIFLSVISSMYFQQISWCSLPPTLWDFCTPPPPPPHFFMKMPGLQFPWDSLRVCPVLSKGLGTGSERLQAILGTRGNLFSLQPNLEYKYILLEFSSTRG